MTLTIQPPDERLYQRIAASIENQIRQQVLQVGDKLPSLRTICREYGVSASTAIQAYHLLETRALISARPQSGYYVCANPRKPLGIIATTAPSDQLQRGDMDELVVKVYNNFGYQSNYLPLSLGVPHPSLMPIAKLNKGLVHAMRSLPDSGVGMEHPMGNLHLRQQVARWAFAMEANMAAENIITTAGCLQALSYALMAITQPGDAVAVESPVSFGILELVKSLRLRVVELPTHPQTGVDLEALEKLLKKQSIQACLFIPNFSNPLGCCMPDAHKKELVRLIEHYQVPLIENDLNADIYFGNQRPKSCRTYDQSGLVLWCGSVSKSLASGYRVGWIEPGRFREKVFNIKMHQAISTTTLTQEVIAHFLETGRYEAHLRSLRQKLYANYLQFVRAIQDYFPDDTKLSQPQGGFVLWVELNKKIDTLEVYEKALRQKVSIAPGKMFSLQEQYNHCLRLNYGLPWNAQTERGLQIIGKLIRRS
jgi:DNA-binding transcriptional MocR family regulator